MIKKDKEIFAKKTNSKTYFKYGMAAVLVLFIVFVVYRQISIQNQVKHTVLAKDKSKKDKRLSETKEKNRLDKMTETQIKEEKIVEATQSKPSEVLVEETTASKKRVQEAMQKVVLAKQQQESMDKSINNVSKSQKKQLDISQLFEEDNKRNTIASKSIQKSTLQKIATPFDLKSIQNKMNIKNNQMYMGEEVYTEGKHLGEFVIVKIQSNRIRFKKDNTLFYDLRFFN